jgi:MFS family permease
MGMDRVIGGSDHRQGKQVKRVFVGWWQVVVSMLNQAVAPGTIITCFSVIAFPIQKEFATSRVVLMLTMTLTYLVNGLANPLLGAAMDRYSLRKILMGGAVCLAAGYFALSFSTSIIHVYLAYGLLLALALTALGPLSYSTLLPRWFVRRRARAVGLTVAGYALGGMVLPIIFQKLIELFGWRDAVRLFACFVIVVVLPIVAWLVVDRPADVGLFEDDEAQPPPVEVGNSIDERQTTRDLMAMMNFWVVTLAIGLVLCGVSGVLGNLVPIVTSKGFTASQGAVVVSCFSAGSLILKLLYAAIGDRLTPRLGLSGGLMFFLLSNFFFLNADTYPMLLIASFLLGGAVGVSLPLWSYLTARLFGARNVGRVFGLMTLLVMPISLVAPPILGRIYDVTGNYDYGFIGFISLALAMFVLVSRLRMAAQASIPS